MSATEVELEDAGRMPWFGEPWPRAELRAPICLDDRRRVPVPVGRVCFLCGYEIRSDDRGLFMFGLRQDGSTEDLVMHIECNLRNVSGCFGLVSGQGTHTHDVDYRQDALMVWKFLQDRG